jgi:hypothetical protein
MYMNNFIFKENNMQKWTADDKSGLTTECDNTLFSSTDDAARRIKDICERERERALKPKTHDSEERAGDCKKLVGIYIDIIYRVKKTGNQIEWFKVYDLIDVYFNYIEKHCGKVNGFSYVGDKINTKCNNNYFTHLDHLFIECCNYRYYNVCEYIFRKKYKCDFSFDICNKIIENYINEKSNENSVHMWINYIFESHFLNCNADEKYNIYKRLCECKLLLDKYFYLFWEYFFNDFVKNNKDSSYQYVYNYILKDDFASINTSQELLVLFMKNYNFLEMGVFIRPCMQFSWIVIYLRAYRTQNTTQQWMHIISAWVEDGIVDSQNLCDLYIEFFDSDPAYFLDNIYNFQDFDPVLYKCFYFFACDATVKHRIKKLFFDFCVQSKLDIVYIIFKCCKNDIFLFDYIYNEKTALDMLLELYENSFTYCIDNNKNIHDIYSNNNKIYFIFDNYKDPFCKYPVHNVCTYKVLLEKCDTVFESLDELINYFTQNYEHSINYFLYENTKENFSPGVRDTLFARYPELVYSLKFRQYLDMCHPKDEYIPNYKVERMCKLLYIPDELSKCIKMTYKEYFDFAVKYHL